MFHHKKVFLAFLFHQEYNAINKIIDFLTACFTKNSKFQTQAVKWALMSASKKNYEFENRKNFEAETTFGKIEQKKTKRKENLGRLFNPKIFHKIKTCRLGPCWKKSRY